MATTADNHLTEQGFEAYPKRAYDNMNLAFRNTERNVFVITDLGKIHDGPGVRYRIQLPETHKVTFKSGMLSKTRSFLSVKVSFNGCYHNGDGEMLVDFKLERLLKVSEAESDEILEHRKFRSSHIQIPVYPRLEDSRIYLLLDSRFEFEALDADKQYSCFSRVEKARWQNF